MVLNQIELNLFAYIVDTDLDPNPESDPESDLDPLYCGGFKESNSKY